MGNNNSYYRKSYIAQDFSQPPYMPSRAKLHRSTSEYRGRASSTPPLQRTGLHEQRRYLVPENKVMHENPAFGIDQLKSSGKLEALRSGGTLRDFKQRPASAAATATVDDVDECVDELIQKLNHRSRLLVKSEWAMKRSNSVGDLVESTTSRSLSDGELEDMLSSQCSALDDFHLGEKRGDGGGIGLGAGNGLRKSRKKSRAPPPPPATSSSPPPGRRFSDDANNNEQKKAKKKGKKSPAPPPPRIAADDAEVTQGSLAKSQSFQSMVSIRTADIEETEKLMHIRKQEQIAHGIDKERTNEDIIRRSAEIERDLLKRNRRKSDPLGRLEKVTSSQERRPAQRSDSILDVLANLKNRKNNRSKSADNRLEEDDPTKGFVLRRYTGSHESLSSPRVAPRNGAQNGSADSLENVDNVDFSDMHMSVTTKLTEKILQHLKRGDYKIRDVKSGDNGMMFTIADSTGKMLAGSSHADVADAGTNDDCASASYDDRNTGFTLQPVMSEHSFNSERTSEWVRQAAQYGDNSSCRDTKDAMLDLSSESDWDDPVYASRDDVAHRKSSPGTECSDMLTGSASSFAWNVKPNGYNSKPRCLPAGTALSAYVAASLPKDCAAPSSSRNPHILESKIKLHVRPTLPKKEWEPDYAFDPELAWERVKPGVSTESDEQQQQRDAGDVREDSIEKKLVPVLPRKTQKMLDMLHVSEDDGYNSQHSPASSDQQNAESAGRGQHGGWTPEMDLNGELDDAPTVKGESNSADRAQVKPVLTLQNMFSRSITKRDDCPPSPDRTSPASMSLPISPMSTTSPSSSSINDNLCTGEYQQRCSPDAECNTTAVANNNNNNSSNNNNSGGGGANRMNKIYSFKNIQKSVKDALGNNRKTRKSEETMALEYEPSSNWIMRQTSPSDMDSDRADTQERIRTAAPTTASDSFLRRIPEINAAGLSQDARSPAGNKPKKFGHAGGHQIYLPPCEVAKIMPARKTTVAHLEIASGIAAEEEIAERERQREEEKKEQEHAEKELRSHHDQDKLIMERHLFKVPESGDVTSRPSLATQTPPQSYENSDVIVQKLASRPAKDKSPPTRNGVVAAASASSARAENSRPAKDLLYENSGMQLAAICISDLKNQTRTQQQHSPSPPPPLPVKQKSSREREGLSSRVQAPPDGGNGADVDVVLGTRVQTPDQREKSIEAWIRKQQLSVGVSESDGRPAATAGAAVTRPSNGRPTTKSENASDGDRRDVIVDRSAAAAAAVPRDQFFFGMESEQKRKADGGSLVEARVDVHRTASGNNATESKARPLSDSAQAQREPRSPQRGRTSNAARSYSQHDDPPSSAAHGRPQYRQNQNEDRVRRPPFEQRQRRSGYEDQKPASGRAGCSGLGGQRVQRTQHVNGVRHEGHAYERFSKRSPDARQSSRPAAAERTDYQHDNQRPDYRSKLTDSYPEAVEDEWEIEKKGFDRNQPNRRGNRRRNNSKPETIDSWDYPEVAHQQQQHSEQQQQQQQQQQHLQQQQHHKQQQQQQQQPQRKQQQHYKQQQQLQRGRGHYPPRLSYTPAQCGRSAGRQGQSTRQEELGSPFSHKNNARSSSYQPRENSHSSENK
ncbi:PREDICTED: uncharacterized protein LOC106821054 [Priapulus caudatus]|uniref:Uncharacterized protein LOC106821054 n=1 Tax=Priapulus caudatus TaxID=37621 RepID=A0ABM1F9R1_PRICU|nr:PREDICTED: uncharacterized protein LOC106821054 [Priapulus caudatus]